jgi:hypothetical protein
VKEKFEQTKLYNEKKQVPFYITGINEKEKEGTDSSLEEQKEVFQKSNITSDLE